MLRFWYLFRHPGTGGNAWARKRPEPGGALGDESFLEENTGGPGQLSVVPEEQWRLLHLMRELRIEFELP